MRLPAPTDAIVLAGGINYIPLFAGYTPGYKALLPFRGTPALQYVLRALCATPQIRRVCIVGPEEDLRPAMMGIVGKNTYDFAPPGETLLDSVVGGLRHFANSRVVLIVTADLPLLNGQALTDFLIACGQIETTYDQNIFLAVVPSHCYIGPYANCPKLFNRFRDMAVCHGNVVLADPRLVDSEAAVRMNHIYNARKDPVTAALAVGWWVGLSYVLGVHLLHMLTLNQMSRIASRRFGLGLCPVILHHPEVTLDVDEATDYAFINELLEKASG